MSNAIASDDLIFGILLAGSVALFIPGRFAPWCDIDRLIVNIYLGMRRAMLSPGPPNHTALARSATARIKLLKGSVWGAILIFLLPLHHWTGTAWAIDWVWYIPDWTRHTLRLIAPSTAGYFEEHYWRAAPYEIWEICVFVWAIPFLSGSVRDDCIDWLTSARAETEQAFRYFYLVNAVSWLFAGVGAATLVIFQNPFIRLSFELTFVTLILGFDTWFAFKYAAIRRHADSAQFLEMVLVIDAPAMLAFTVLLLFMRSSFLEDLPYQSHWSSPFVAGASALNLIFASSATIVLRMIHTYRRASVAELVTCEVSSDGLTDSAVPLEV
jgi:hypothetical protein